MEEPVHLPRPDLETVAHADDRIELRLWLRLLTCVNMIEREVRGNLRAQFDTTLPRFDLLAQLDRSPQGLTMTELSDRLMVSNGNITGLAERLVQEGLVTREAPANDRRRMRLKLTAGGKKAFDEMTPCHQAWVHEMFADLDRHDMSDLLDLLGRLKQSLANHASAKEEKES